MNYKKIIVWSAALNILLLIFSAIFYAGRYVPLLTKNRTEALQAFRKDSKTLSLSTSPVCPNIDLATGLLFLTAILSLFPILIFSIVLIGKLKKHTSRTPIAGESGRRNEFTGGGLQDTKALL